MTGRHGRRLGILLALITALPASAEDEGQPFDCGCSVSAQVAQRVG